jgi:membrane protease YdiL (CAAX protease family)
LIRRIFSEAFSKGQSQISQDNRPDYKVMAILTVVALSLSLIRYLGEPGFFTSMLNSIGAEETAAKFHYLVTRHEDAQLYRLTHWVSSVIVFYLLPPIIVIKVGFRERLRDYGLSFKGAFKDYKVYLIMLCVMLPLVLYFSTTSSFQARYPFYDMRRGESIFPNLLIWEGLYFIQFFALEFFFRGFMLHGTTRRFGFYSVFVMMIPYCMIHFGKPFPETIAAIIAGVVLGVLSLKSRSIWLGVAIHCSVAMTMDIASLAQKSLMP